MKKLYETLLDILNNVADLKYIDLNTGQLDLLAHHLHLLL